MNKEPSKSRFGFSEEEMANAFQCLLDSPSGLPGSGAFDAVYRETNCRQGRPDFIALRGLSKQGITELPCAPGFVGPSILSILKLAAPRTFDFIVSKSEFSRDVIRKALRLLLESGQVTETETGAYLLSRGLGERKIEIWSFELKLDNPKRAVFQAQQSRAFADRAMIVIPPGQERNYEKYYETMKRWGIGLAAFSPITGQFYFIKRSRKSRAFCQTHQIYAMSQLQAHIQQT